MASKAAASLLREDATLFQLLKTRFYLQFETQPVMPSLVRLAWHDAACYSAETGSGQPNGSIRFPKALGYAFNKGLEVPLATVEEVRTDYPEVGYADLIQAAAYAAILYCKGPEVPFLFGRIDALTDDECPPEGLLPAPTGDAEHLRAVFARSGFSDVELVALVGAHTIGKATPAYSEYEGSWTDQPFKFDNAYFVELLTKKQSKLLRLPTDEALLTDPELRKWVEAFAQDKFLFFEEFTQAFKKLSELGYHSNKTD